MATNQKKVVVRKMDGTLAWGYLAQGGFVDGGTVEIMEPDGWHKSFLLSEIKMISYVRDFNLNDRVDPERMGRRAYLGRPKGEGVWVRVTFLDGDAVEGLSGFGLGFLDGVLEDKGVFLTPPELRSNTLRVFVPRLAMGSLELLGAVLSSGRIAAKRVGVGQAELFGS